MYQVSVVVLGGQKSPHEGWELNQSLLKDQQVFLPAEPSFQALGFSYKQISKHLRQIFIYHISPTSSNIIAGQRNNNYP